MTIIDRRRSIADGRPEGFAVTPGDVEINHGSVEITPAMVDAGIAALWSFAFDDSHVSDECIRAVYAAMERVRFAALHKNSRPRELDQRFA